MEIVTPKRGQFLLPAGTREVQVAEHQPEYLTLPSLVTPDGKVASQWQPTPGELALLNAGVPVTLVVWTFGKPLQPVSLGVGGMDLR
jgi:hypothetical protein